MKKPLLYYIDDSPDLLELAGIVIERDNRFELRGFLEERELYEALEKEKPDGLILDLNLGQTLTGSVLSIKLRKLYPDIPIAIYTSYEKIRVESFIPDDELETGKTIVWSKSDVGVDEFSEAVANLIS